MGYGNNANSNETKRKHWAKRVEEGYSMREWEDGLPTIAKEYWGE